MTAAINVLTRAKKATTERVLTVSLCVKVLPVRGYGQYLLKPACQWDAGDAAAFEPHCALCTPCSGDTIAVERSSEGVRKKNKHGITEQYHPGEVFPDCSKSCNFLIGQEERGGRRKMRPHWRITHQQTHWLDTVGIYWQRNCFSDPCVILRFYSYLVDMG